MRQFVNNYSKINPSMVAKLQLSLDSKFGRGNTKVELTTPTTLSILNYQEYPVVSFCCGWLAGYKANCR